MFIYKVEDKLNNKTYIGASSRNSKSLRWNEHKSKSRHLDVGGSSRLLSQAMATHGIDNFNYSVLEDDISSLEELKEKENRYILELNTVTPNGYNIEVFAHKRRILPKSSLDHLSKSHQGLLKSKRKTSKYIGVSFDKTTINCEISKDTRRYKRACSSEVEAAISYDKLAIFLYGEGAKLNFPENLKNYLSLNLLDFFTYFTSFEWTSKYIGVTWNIAKNRWRSSITLNGKLFHIKYCKDEDYAAELYDKAVIFFNKDISKLNFPDKLNYYKTLDLNIEFEKKKKTSSYRGVYFVKNTGKWSSKLEYNKVIYHCGYWENEILAAESVDRMMLKLGVKCVPLNFPDKLDKYSDGNVYIAKKYKKNEKTNS